MSDLMSAILTDLTILYFEANDPDTYQSIIDYGDLETWDDGPCYNEVEVVEAHARRNYKSLLIAGGTIAIVVFVAVVNLIAAAL